MPNDTYEVYEFHGTVTEWNGMIGAITTDCGERVVLSIARLAVLGFMRPPALGDCIHFWAQRKVEVTYQITEVRMIIPADASE